MLAFRCVVSLAVAFTSLGAARAQSTWYVDASATPPGVGTPVSPYASIQYAIQQPTTLSGDRVLVAPGTYAETVRFLGKELHVRSTSGAAATVIDVSTLGDVGVRFVNGEGPGAILEGFTITGADPGFGIGGGVVCSSSQAELRDCRIESCGGLGSSLVGAGVAVVNGSLSLVRCQISGCSTQTDGAGIYASGGVLRMHGGSVSNCTTVYGTGAGLHAFASAIELANVQFAGNVSMESFGGAMYLRQSNARVVDSEFSNCSVLQDHTGGAAQFDASVATLERCRFAHNSAARGGAIDTVAGLLEVRDTRFEHNIAESFQAYDGSGGAVFCAGPAYFTRCEFFDNESRPGPSQSGLGGGARGGVFDRCTFARNRCDPSNGGAGAAAADALLRSCIVWGNLPTPLWSLYNSSSSYSDLEKPVLGVGNISSDPLFVSLAQGDLRLNALSPCIDAGDALGGSDLDGSRIDMGASAFYPSYGSPAVTYCTAKLTSNGCAPYLTVNSAPPSVSGGLFEVHARSVRDNRPGLLFWGTAPAATPFQGGTLCVSNVNRTSIQTSTLGAGLPGCAGLYSYRWTSAYLASVGLNAGAAVHCQFWFRDPSASFTVGLSNAVQFTLAP